MVLSLTKHNIKSFLLALKGMGVDSYVINKEDTITLLAIQRAVKGCHRCDLDKTRRNVVFGEGSNKAKVMFIVRLGGDEDIQGRPFCR